MISVSCFLPFNQASMLPDGQQEQPLEVVSNVSGSRSAEEVVHFHKYHTLTHTYTDAHTHTHRDT